MDTALSAVLGVCVRWIHIASVVTLIGGFIYVRFVLAPALASLPASEGEAVGSKVVSGFRPFSLANRLKNSWARSGMSSSRSRRGGITIWITCRR